MSGRVFITSPTYDGVCSDVAAIARAAHRRGLPLIVDGAHGAHFGMHPLFPENAVRQGADLVIHSLQQNPSGPYPDGAAACTGGPGGQKKA